jgi:phosphonate transport system substrate-binding protein
MPRYFFSAEGVEPESFFAQVTYSGAHDRTIERIVAGEVDAGAVNAQIAEAWISRQSGETPSVRVVWQSPSYVDYVWAVQPAMTRGTQRAIKEVFLNLSRENPNEARFLAAVGAAYFIPAHKSDFDRLRAAVKSVDGMLGMAH